jgi:hypothetical protein
VTLKELDARFCRITGDRSFLTGCDLTAAQGIIFLCPKCYAANSGPVGTHSVICWFRGRGVPDDLDPRPGRWTPAGTGLDDLTFVPGDPPMAVSVLLAAGCGWHGFVRDGEATP